VTELRYVDVTDEETFRAIPPCADPRFDHRTCDYWEDADRGAKTARPELLTPPRAPEALKRPPAADNPFLPDPTAEPLRAESLAAALDPLGGDDLFATPAWNPFAPAPPRDRSLRDRVPRKLALLDRGRGVFGSYARVLEVDGRPVAYAQFGPLSAYPRAGRLRELYPQLPDAPPPAVITCVATVAGERGRGYAHDLVQDVCHELARRGFAAVEAYPDLTRATDETSAAAPGFWVGCGFTVAVDDERFPVLRRELE
jgi:hypothetical protein